MNTQCAASRWRPESFDHGRHDLRHHHHRLWPGRLCDRDPGGAARLQDRDRRARVSRRHLPQLGLHPDQGAPALGRDLPLPAARQGLWALGREGRVRPVGRRQALARRLEAAQRRRRLPDEEEQGERDLGRGRDRRARQSHGQGRQERSPQGHARARQLSGQAHHPRDRRAPARAARARAGPEAGVDLFRGDGARAHAEIAAGHRLRRDRHRVRLVLSHARRRGDGG